MKLAIAGAGVLPGLLVACSPAAEGEPEPASVTVEEVVQIPADVVGQWYLVRQECEEGVDPEEWQPRTDLPRVMLFLDDGGHYNINVEGWSFPGTFVVNGGPDRLSVTLDEGLQNFDVVDGTLQNWSEGEAVYICGNVFEREPYDRYR